MLAMGTAVAVVDGDVNGDVDRDRTSIVVLMTGDLQKA